MAVTVTGVVWCFMRVRVRMLAKAMTSVAVTVEAGTMDVTVVFIKELAGFLEVLDLLLGLVLDLVLDLALFALALALTFLAFLAAFLAAFLNEPVFPPRLFFPALLLTVASGQRTEVVYMTWLLLRRPL